MYVCKGRQWGRGRMAAEGRHPGEVCVPAGPSMGPRPDGRGRPSFPLLRQIRIVPSVGPRPDGRGRLYQRHAGRQTHVPSMGPRPDGRGRSGGLLGPDFALRPVNGAAAGWPRKDPPADRCACCRLPSMGPRPDGRGRVWYTWRRPPGHHPSMGPRPDGRGRLNMREAANGTAVSRQWGRGRMAAEGRPAPSTRASDRSVNGAAAGCPRKVCLRPRSTRATCRQWGRGRMAAEGRAPRAKPTESSAVNGAAAGWPRKAAARRRGPAWRRCRQWGRGRMAAEGWHMLEGDARRERIRQWGRGRMAAEGV